MAVVSSDLGILAAAFAAGSALGAVGGAANLGTAMTFGALAFGAAMVFVLVRR